MKRASPSLRRLPFRERSAYLIVPLWLCATHYISGIDPKGRTGALSYAQGASLSLMILYCAWIGRRGFFRPEALRKPSAMLLLAVAFIGIISGVVSVDPVVSLMSWGALLIALVLCAGLWSVIGRDPARALGIYAVISSYSTFALYLVFNTGSRYAWYVNPNTWGLYCFGAAVCALLIKNRLTSLTVIAVSVFVVVKSESRASLVGIVMALSVYFFFHLRKKSFTPLHAGAGFVLIAMVVAPLLFFGDKISDDISEALQLSSRNRGVGSGFTGRADAWNEAITVFYEHPVIGIGPRLQSRYIDFGGLKNAHNGYLVALIELGLFGFLLLMAWIGILVWLQFKSSMQGNRFAVVGLSMWAGYAFIGMFDSRLINAGNPTSLLVWFFLLMPPSLMFRSQIRRAKIIDRATLPETPVLERVR